MECGENNNSLTHGDPAGFSRVRQRAMPCPPQMLVCDSVIANRFPESADDYTLLYQGDAYPYKTPRNGALSDVALWDDFDIREDQFRH
jgi:hypothetical protein